MNWNRVELKEKGKFAFKRNYWPCVLVAFILALVSGNGGNSSSQYTQKQVSQEKPLTEMFNFSGIKEHFLANSMMLMSLGIALVVVILVGLIIFALAIAARIFALNPLAVGCHRFFLENSYSDQAKLNLIGSAFKGGNYRTVVITMLLRDLHVFLWALLFVIPGIIKAYEYRMIPYLLAENPYITTEEAFRQSKQMMDGQKMDAFILDLSFIGWHLLSALTLGILEAFYVAPYQQATNTELFYALKR